MYVGPHDVYPTIDVNFSILTRECKNKKVVVTAFNSLADAREYTFLTLINRYEDFFKLRSKVDFV